MSLILKDFNPVRGSAYKFSYLDTENDGIGVVLERRVGLYDNLGKEEAPSQKKLSVKALFDFYTGAYSDRVSRYLTIDGRTIDLYPQDELKKGIDAVKDLPHSILSKDAYVSSYFNDRHKWPFKPWGYQGLKIVAADAVIPVKPSGP